MPLNLARKKAVIVFLVVFVLLAGSYATLRHLSASYAFIPFVPSCYESSADGPIAHELYGQMTLTAMHVAAPTFYADPSRGDYKAAVNLDMGRKMLLLTFRQWLARSQEMQDKTLIEGQWADRYVHTSYMVMVYLRKRFGEKPGDGLRQMFPAKSDPAIDECDVVKELILVGGKYAGDEKPEPDWKLPEWYLKYFALDGRDVEEDAQPWWYYAAVVLFEPGFDDTEQDNAP